MLAVSLRIARDPWVCEYPCPSFYRANESDALGNACGDGALSENYVGSCNERVTGSGSSTLTERAASAASEQGSSRSLPRCSVALDESFALFDCVDTGDVVLV